MASSSTFPDVHLPVRSISLPSRIHPTSVEVDAVLNHLKTWQASPSSTTSSIQVGLVGLAELYNCLGELIQSPQTQQALHHYKNGQIVEEALDRSITLLDICGAARDIMPVMKEHLQTLQSALRRRGGDSRIETDISTYLRSRKKVNKETSKYLRETRSLQNKMSNSITVDMDPHLQMVVRVMQEASTVTISILQSFFLFLSMSAMKTKATGWSKISKMISSRLLSSDKGQKIITELGTVDIAICSLQGRAGKSDSKATQQMIEELLCTMDGLETGLEGLFRCLVRNRVSLLDILVH